MENPFPASVKRRAALEISTHCHPDSLPLAPKAMDLKERAWPEVGQRQLAFVASEWGSVQASLGHKSRDVTEKHAKAVALLNSGTAEKTANVFGLEVK